MTALLPDCPQCGRAIHRAERIGVSAVVQPCGHVIPAEFFRPSHIDAGVRQELVADGGLPTIPFDSQFLEPIARREKTATLRLERYDVEAGDEVLLTNANGRVEYALAEVTTTFTCRAIEARQLLAAIDARHALTTTERSVTDVLRPHYDERVESTTVLQGIAWRVVQSYVEDPVFNGGASA
jgi:hypothetical protein